MVRLRSYRRSVPRRSPKPPRPGPPLAEQLRLTHHAIQRFQQRAPDLAGDEPRARLAELVESQGVVLTEPLPHWLQGDAPAGGFLIAIQGRYVIPVRPVRADVMPARPWRATTFISRELSAEDLRELTGDDLAALTLIAARVARRWAEGSRHVEDASETQRCDSVVELRRELARIPCGGQALSWVPTKVAGRDELHVRMADGTLVLVRPRREEQHRARFRTVAWIRDRGHPYADRR